MKSSHIHWCLECLKDILIGYIMESQENYNSINEGENYYDDMLSMIHDAAGPNIMEEIMTVIYEKD